jgi:type IV secretion system protein VirB2
MSSGGMLAAVQWVEQLLLGSVATVTAVIAVGLIGLLSLDGRFDWKRGARTILGCFLIFGVPIIAAGLILPVDSSRPNVEPQNAEASIAPPPPRPAEQYDPYAGAALPQGW